MSESGDGERKERDLTARKFYRAVQEAGFACDLPDDTPQTRHPAYRLAFQDQDFLLREELRPIRFQLELLKPEILLDEARVGSTLVVCRETEAEARSVYQNIIDNGDGEAAAEPAHFRADGGRARAVAGDTALDTKR